MTKEEEKIAQNPTVEDPTAPPGQPWQAVLTILTASAVLMSVSYTMLIPFLPVYLTDELHVAADQAKFWSGLIFSISFLISGIMAPIWGGDCR